MHAILTYFLSLSLFFIGLSNIEAKEKSMTIQTFGKNVVGDYDACRFALWEKGRSQEIDNLDYVFFAPFNDGEVLPGWIQVDGRIMELDRKDTPATDGLFDGYQLYQTHEKDIWLIMEINDRSSEGDVDYISDAVITVITDQSIPVVSANLEGHLFCPQNYIEQTDIGLNASDGIDSEPTYGDPIAPYSQRSFDSFEDVPQTIIQYIRDNLDQCDLDNVPVYANRYSISDAMSLWQLPCAIYARNTTSVFVVALNDNPDHFSVLSTLPPTNVGANRRADILNATLDITTGRITSVNINADSSCGTFEIHQLSAVEGEAIELTLLEFREKQECDLISTDPKTFPLIFQRP